MSLSSIFPDEEEVKGYNFIDFSQLIMSTILHTYDEGDLIDLNLIRHTVLNSIRFNVLKNKDKYPNIVICCDNANGGYWRRQKAYYYKKHRSEKREKDNWDWDDIYKSINTVSGEIKDNLPYKVINLPHTEADDIIGVLCKHVSLIDPGAPILITSADGDFTQLHKFKNVKQWSPIQKKWVNPKYGSPMRDLLTKIVKGDAKDTVANIFMPSDFIITKEEGKRQKSVTSDLLVKVYESKDPRSLFTGDELKRFDENQLLLDFEKIPDTISKPIIDEFTNLVPAPRRKIYPYFVKNALIKLINIVNDF